MARAVRECFSDIYLRDSEHLSAHSDGEKGTRIIGDDQVKIGKTDIPLSPESHFYGYLYENLSRELIYLGFI